jgi:hypothetical protein
LLRLLLLLLLLLLDGCPAHLAFYKCNLLPKIGPGMMATHAWHGTHACRTQQHKARSCLGDPRAQ